MMKVPTEVFTRVTGFFRPVNHFNLGKKSEFNERKFLKIPTLITSDYKKESPQKGE